MTRNVLSVVANPPVPNLENALVPVGNLGGREVAVQQSNQIPEVPEGVVQYFREMTELMMRQYQQERNILVGRITQMESDLKKEREERVADHGQNINLQLENGQKTRQLERQLELEQEQRTTLAKRVHEEEQNTQRITQQLQAETQQRTLLTQQVEIERNERGILAEQVTLNKQQKNILQRQVQLQVRQVHNLVAQVNGEKGQREILQAQVALNGHQIQGLVQQVAQVKQQKDTQLAVQAQQAALQLKGEREARLKVLQMQLTQTTKDKN
ncbi:MAG: hypothetical protein V4487_02760, partial [Chlamydiota bacterium]